MYINKVENKLAQRDASPLKAHKEGKKKAAEEAAAMMEAEEAAARKKAKQVAMAEAAYKSAVEQYKKGNLDRAILLFETGKKNGKSSGMVDKFIRKCEEVELRSRIE